MREILFRGKRIDNGEWIYGDICNHDGVISYIGQHPADGSMLCYDLDPSTIGQYTGLTDKNGSRIFEGDIVRCSTGRICKVIFFISPGVSGFDLVPIGGFDAPPPYKWSLFTDTEVIGNIHDNPELLKVNYKYLTGVFER